MWNDDSLDANTHRFIERLDAKLTDDITDIFISARTGVWMRDRAGRNTQVEHDIPESLARAVAVELIGRGGRHIDDARPAVDVALGDGVRVHAVLGGVSVGGTEVSIRLPARECLRLDETLDQSAQVGEIALLRNAVARAQTLLVTGSAGAGKTTLLAALLALVPRTERIIVIEDVAELRIPHPRVISLETRPANTEGRGAIGLPELIRQTLRMRPDRLVLGECRGSEIVDILMAFTTGHSGGGTTLHANGLAEVPSRLIALCALAGRRETDIAQLVCSAIDLVVHVDARASVRRVSLGRLTVHDAVTGWRLGIEPVQVVEPVETHENE